MVIVSYGTLKSASSFAWQIVDLHLKCGFIDNKAYNKYRRDGLPSEFHDVHFEIKDKECEELVSLLPLKKIYHFKTHSVFNNIAFSNQRLPKLSDELNQYLSEGSVKIIGSIRDPREIVLSAMDHGHRVENDGSFFSELARMEDSYPHVKRNFEKAALWHKTGVVQWIPYDLVLSSPHKVNDLISNHLGFDSSNVTSKLDWLLANKNKIVQYNKGTASRYKSELSLDKQKELADIFAQEIALYEEILASIIT